jgi:hypothetical protein
MEEPIDRRSVIDRHAVILTRPHPEHVLTVGNGDFACTVDVTGMQTFTEFHDPAAAMRAGGVAVNTATMSSWGWHEMPSPRRYVLDDAMSTYETARGPVSYPDRFDMQAAMRGELRDEDRAGAWLHMNPQRIDLGRVGLELRDEAGGSPTTDPNDLTEMVQRLDLWTGVIESTFRFANELVRVQTAASPDRDVVAFRIESLLLQEGRAAATLRFPYAHDGFFQTADWDAGDRHMSELTRVEPGHSVVRRTLDATAYRVDVWSSCGDVSATQDPHVFTVAVDAEAVEIVVAFTVDPAAAPERLSFEEVSGASAHMWEQFWMSGAAIDFSGSADPRAQELERRIVLSQYQTRVNSSGSLPPAETGLVSNSWQGKFHLEMHFWHAAHFAAWGRPELLENSLRWYVSILEAAKATARRQGYPGARWPKHVGPDGRESPDPIGSLLIWQQPHILYLLDMVWRASDETSRDALVAEYSEVVEATAEFMASFPEDRDGVLHLGPPVMPAQEFYEARSTQDPTFELAYWHWGLEIAQLWRERAGLDRRAAWADVQQRLARPRIVDGQYVAVDSEAPMRRDDHPSLVAALGVVPETPLIEPAVMAETLSDVLGNWEWPTAWGWDFPMLAMTAARLGQPQTAVDTLLRDETKNRYTVVGHNPQMGGILPIYLPANGGLLSAVSLMVGTTEDGALAGFPRAGWSVKSEGFVPWP